MMKSDYKEQTWHRPCLLKTHTTLKYTDRNQIMVYVTLMVGGRKEMHSTRFCANSK
jgi:hypothetical protein